MTKEKLLDELKNTAVDEKWAANFLGLNPRTLANWRFRRQGPPYLKIGGRISYVVSDLMTYRESKRIDPFT